MIRDDMNLDLNKNIIVVTLKSPQQVSKCFCKQLRWRNRDMEIGYHYLPISLKRRQVLFEWVKEVCQGFPRKNFQVRVGKMSLNNFKKATPPRCLC